jgi:hypothetical protein
MFTWRAMGVTGKRAKDYERLYKGLIGVAERNIDPEHVWDGLRVLMEWIDGIPPAKTVAGELRREQYVIIPALERIGDMIASMIEKIGRERYPERLRPAYLEVARILPKASYYGWDRKTIARELGISERTVRDALWYMRRIGVGIPYGAFSYRFPG